MLNKNLNIIAENSTFKGTFTLKGSIQINGNFEGEIQTDHNIIIAPSGVVKSNLSANKVIVSGELVGDIKAYHSVIISATGKVTGNITSPNLKIEDGAITFGKISINEN